MASSDFSSSSNPPPLSHQSDLDRFVHFTPDQKVKMKDIADKQSQMIEMRIRNFLSVKCRLKHQIVIKLPLNRAFKPSPKETIQIVSDILPEAPQHIQFQKGTIEIYYEEEKDALSVYQRLSSELNQTIKGVLKCEPQIKWNLPSAETSILISGFSALSAWNNDEDNLSLIFDVLNFPIKTLSKPPERLKDYNNFNNIIYKLTFSEPPKVLVTRSLSGATNKWCIDGETISWEWVSNGSKCSKCSCPHPTYYCPIDTRQTNMRSRRHELIDRFALDENEKIVLNDLKIIDISSPYRSPRSSLQETNESNEEDDTSIFRNTSNTQEKNEVEENSSKKDDEDLSGYISDHDVSILPSLSNNEINANENLSSESISDIDENSNNKQDINIPIESPKSPPNDKEADGKNEEEEQPVITKEISKRKKGNEFITQVSFRDKVLNSPPPKGGNNEHNNNKSITPNSSGKQNQNNGYKPNQFISNKPNKYNTRSDNNKGHTKKGQQNRK